VVAPANTGPRIGATLASRYHLRRRLDETPTTESWEALDARLDRTVLLRVLREDHRHDGVAQDELRQLARQRTLDAHPGSPRVLDGGDDPVLGPFVVAELNEQYAATRPLPLIPPTRPAVVAEVGASRNWAGPLVLALLALVIIASALLIAHLLQTPATLPAPSPTVVPTEPPGRPLPGAQPASQPTTPPTPVPTPRPTVAPTSPPTPPPTQPAGASTVAGSPVDTIRQHYALINAHNYAAGYQLMDSHLQSLNSPSDYAGWFANKVAIQPISIDLVSQTADQATVRSLVASTDRVNGQDVTTQVQEEFVLRKEGGAWRIDQVTRIS
jgi:hypothetical protein